MDSVCCGVTLKIRNTINAGPGGQTQTGVCTGCGKVFCLVTLTKAEVSGYGTGAAAEARRIRDARTKGGTTRPVV